MISEMMDLFSSAAPTERLWNEANWFRVPDAGELSGTHSRVSRPKLRRSAFRISAFLFSVGVFTFASRHRPA